MKKPSAVRAKVKQMLYGVLGSERVDNVRNSLSFTAKYTFDRELRKRVLGAIGRRNKNIPIAKDLDLLVELHKLFPTYDLSDNYIPQRLLETARGRFSQLARLGVDLKDKDFMEFGAGHGENLLVASEFGVKSSLGLDFDDGRFKLLRDKVSTRHATVEYECLDLVSADIGSQNSDVIMSFSAFEHFDQPGEVLNRCYQSLRKGGVLYAEFAAFHAPFAIHRKKFCGVPYIQNIFSEETAYEFFYDYLRINDEINRYTEKKITDRNPYPEVNRWCNEDYENIFLNQEKWRTIKFQKVINYQYWWFAKIFEREIKGLSHDDLYCDYLKFVVEKR